MRRTIGAVLALMVAIGFGQIGQAQSPKPGATASVSGQTAALPANGSARANAAGADGASVAVGWYWVHATNCYSFFDGTYNWLYVYPAEGGYWYTASAQTQTLIAPACIAGNWLAFYVDNTSGHWNGVVTYAFK